MYALRRPKQKDLTRLESLKTVDIEGDQIFKVLLDPKKLIYVLVGLSKPLQLHIEATRKIRIGAVGHVGIDICLQYRC